MQFIRKFDIACGQHVIMPILFRSIQLIWDGDSPNECQLVVLYRTETFVPWIFTLYDMNRMDGISEAFHLLAHSGQMALFGKGLNRREL